MPEIGQIFNYINSKVVVTYEPRGEKSSLLKFRPAPT